MSKVLIFCQASLDLVSVLCLYEKNKESAEVIVYVMGVYNNFKYLKSLKLHNCNISFVDNEVIGTLKDAISIKRKLISIWNDHFREFEGVDVYFFCRMHDYRTVYLVNGLSKNNQVWFIDHYVSSGKKKHFLTPREVVKKLAVYFITGLSSFYTGEERFITFDVKRYSRKWVTEEEDHAVRKKYRVDPVGGQPKSILIFDCNDENCPNYINYGVLLAELGELIVSRGFRLFVKPHPNFGYSRVLDRFNPVIIDPYIPGEFLALEGFDSVIGNATSAIAMHARNDSNNVFSFVDLVEFKDSRVKNEIKSYLVELSQGKLKYIQSPEEIMPGNALR